MHAGAADWEGWRAAGRAYALHVLVMLPALVCSRAFLPLSRGRGYWPRFLRIENPLVDALNKWDSAWYLDIAYRGYNRRSAAFFPLYPWAVAGLHRLTGLSLPVAGLVLANACFLVALWLLFRLVREEEGGDVAHRATLYLALFPTSLYFSASYTEALFLLLVLAAFRAARRNRWAAAAAAGALAALTRNLGAFLLISLGVEHFLRRPPGWEPSGRWWAPGRWVNRETAWFLLLPAALGAHMLLLYRQLGEPLAFLAAQRFWQRSLVLPPATLWRGLWGPVPEWSRAHTVIDLLFAASFLWLLVWGTRRLPWSEWLYFAFGLLIPLSSLTPFAPLTSLPRYVAVLFPGFTVLAAGVREEQTHFALCLFFATGLAIATLLFASWYWVA